MSALLEGIVQVRVLTKNLSNPSVSFWKARRSKEQCYKEFHRTHPNNWSALIVRFQHQVHALLRVRITKREEVRRLRRPLEDDRFEKVLPPRRRLTKEGRGFHLCFLSRRTQDVDRVQDSLLFVGGSGRMHDVVLSQPLPCTYQKQKCNITKRRMSPYRQTLKLVFVCSLFIIQISGFE